jgi:hypothetical protein
MKVALMTPESGWDHRAARETFNGSGTSGRRWPVFTLWASDTRYIEFLADCENKGFLVRVKDGSGAPTEYEFGGGKQIWLPNSPLLVAIGRSNTTSELYIGASLGAGLVETSSDAIALSSGAALTELRFRGAPGTGYNGHGEVIGLRVFGGMCDTTNALTNANIGGAFVNLDFLV